MNTRIELVRNLLLAVGAPDTITDEQIERELNRTTADMGKLSGNIEIIENGPQEQYLPRMSRLIEDLLRNKTLEFAKYALERMDGHIEGAGMAFFRIAIPEWPDLHKDFPPGSPRYISQELWRKLSLLYMEAHSA